MNLALLAPLAAGIGLLAVLPLIAHLSRQVPRDRQAFGAMLLLQRLVKRLRRQRRVKDPLLLLLRALLVAALALAAAAPRLSYPGGTPVVGGSGRVVVVIDQSMSMSLADGGSTLLARGRGEAVQRLTSVPPGTLVGAVAYGERATRLSPTLTADVARVIERIEAVEPTWGGSNLRDGLLEARRLLGGEEGEVFVVTDEAGPAQIAGAAGEIKLLVDAGSAVIPVPVHADPPRNIAVISATYGDGMEGGEVTLRVASYGPLPVEVACEVTLPDGQRIPVFAEVPAEGEVDERVTVPGEAAGGVGKAWCDDPDLPSDDARYFHLPRVGASRVLVIDGDPGDTPTKSEVYFLERALAPWGGMRGGIRPDVETPMGLMALDAETYRVVFLANVPDPRPFASGLAEFVGRGGSVVITVGDNVSPERYNEALGAILPAGLRKASEIASPGEMGIPLQLPDVRHALFAPFARSGRAGFVKIRAHRVMTLDTYEDSDEITTLLRWEGGAPALIERKVGTGRVLLWTGTADLAWNNLPLQSVYMPLVQQLVGYLGAAAGGGEGRFEAIVGDTVAIPLPDLAIEPDVIGPDGAPVNRRFDGSELHFVPDKPGAYTLSVENAPPIAFVAVNTPPEESDVRRTDSIAATEQRIAPDLFRVQVDLSAPLMAAALVLAVLQALLAIATSGAREPQPAEVV